MANLESFKQGVAENANSKQEAKPSPFGSPFGPGPATGEPSERIRMEPNSKALIDSLDQQIEQNATPSPFGPATDVPRKRIDVNPKALIDSLDEQIEKNNQEPRDAAGVALKPYCKVGGSPTNDHPNLRSYVKTEVVLEAIAESRTWAEAFKKIAQKPKSVSLDEHQNLMHNGEDDDLHENIDYSHTSPQNPQRGPQVYASFIPGSNYQDVRLIINSKLEPILVTHSDDPENGKFYQKAQLEEAMKEGNWNSLRLTSNQSLQIPKDIKPGETPGDKMENLLHGLDPITVRPNGAKKDVYLGQHLPPKDNSYIGDEKMTIERNRVVREDSFEPNEGQPLPKTRKTLQAGMER